MPTSKSTRSTPKPPSSQLPSVEAAPTSAEAYRARQVQEGFVLTLPSGAAFRVRRTLDLMKLVRTGRIPNPLASLIADSIKSRGTKPVNLEEQPQEVVPQLFELIDDVVCAMTLAPTVVKPYTAKDGSDEELAKELEWRCPEGALSTDEVDMMDKMFLFSVAMGGATDLETFRKQSEAAMAATPNGQGVSPVAK